MITIKKQCFDINKIAKSGQCFRMYETSCNEYVVIAFGKYLKIKQTNQEILFGCNESEYQKIWRSYFDLDLDYQKIENSIDPKDKYLKQAQKHASGIRILQQDLWEMIVTFIISQQSNIKRIQKTVENLSQKFGSQSVAQDQTVFYAFPSPSQLKDVTEQELRDENLGYRAPYIVDTVQKVLKKELDLEKLKTLPYQKAKEELMNCHGIGMKVADCICLFGLHHLEAFPMDTHINYVLKNYYKQGFPMEKYEKTLGIIQQYMFYEDLYFRESKQIEQN